MEADWVPVLDFPGYEINNVGEVRSSRRGRKERLISPRISFGYVRYGLMRDGKQCWRMAHRLVWEAFNEAIPKDLQINHKNGVKHDNRLENLELATGSENQQHRFQVLGHQPVIAGAKGERNGNAKLNAEIVLAIRQARKDECVSYRVLGDRFGILASTAHRICTGGSWGHV